MRVSGIAREYSTLLFPALDIALNYSLISLVIALHRLSSFFTALSLVISCYRSSPLAIALAVRLVISCYRSSPLVIFLYRLSSLSLSGLPSLVIALYRLSSLSLSGLSSLVIALYRLPSFFTACHRSRYPARHRWLSLFTACHLSLPLDIALYRMSPFLLHLKSKKQKAKNQQDISWFFKLAVKSYCSSSIFSTLFLKSAPSFASRRPYSTKAFI
jgi:hypothetical protein